MTPRPAVYANVAAGLGAEEARAKRVGKAVRSSITQKEPRMAISELDKEILDLDWFALDSTGAIGHFASGGSGAVPSNPNLSLSDLELLTRYFLQREPITTAIANPQVTSRVLLLPDDGALGRYLSCYLAMASRGLYSFDEDGRGYRPRGYFLVAIPVEPLNIASVDLSVAHLLMPYRLNDVVFSAWNDISAEQVLSL
jgi:hypothetical protein